MSAPPRVLLLLHELTLTGAPRLAYGVFRTVRDKVQLTTHARLGGPLATEFRELGELRILTSRAEPRYFAGSAARKVALRGRDEVRTSIAALQARRWRPDLVYVNSAHALPQLGRLRMSDVPVLLHVHESPVALDAFEAGDPGLIRGLPDRYVAVSHAVADELARRYGVPSEMIETIPPFVDPQVGPAAGGESRVLGSVEAPLVVGGVGNPSWFKGHDLWLLAARQTADMLGHGAVRFVWVGVRDNHEGRHFRAMVEKLHLGAVVDLVPETRAASSHIRAFDLLALSSWEESASLAALEAMSYGVPTICFAGSGGPPELVADSGVVLDEFSPAGMAEAIVGLARNPERRAALGAAARERVAANYTPALIVPRIAAAMEFMLRAPRKTKRRDSAQSG